MDRRWALAGGVAGPMLFTLVWLVEQSLRPGYDPMRNWISELSLTERGWVQIAAFVVCGALITASAPGLRTAFPASTWGPRLVVANGVGLVVCGLFTTNPGLDYPPGVAPTTTWQGSVHDAAGLVVFVTAALIAFVYARHTSRAVGVFLGVATLVCWLAAGTLAGLDYAGTWSPAPAGLAERLAILAGHGWLVLLTVRAYRTMSRRPRSGVDHGLRP